MTEDGCGQVVFALLSMVSNAEHITARGSLTSLSDMMVDAEVKEYGIAVAAFKFKKVEFVWIRPYQVNAQQKYPRNSRGVTNYQCHTRDASVRALVCLSRATTVHPLATRLFLTCTWSSLPIWPLGFATP